MSHPIPDTALDDRLAFIGVPGSGKTYGAGTGVERLLGSGARIVIPDALGVWYGLALSADGNAPSKFRKNGSLIVFGGPHGDIGLTEHSGALIGETVAGMAESCILDLSELGTKAAERRFMLAFLTALHKHKTREPLHLIFDEADMWAPTRILDKDGEAAKLLGMMETIVRRGRVAGFIPWLITQRPAVLSWNALSMVEGIVAFKLTSRLDRDAIGNWVEGQADKDEWKEIWRTLPTLERGRGVVWIPGRHILETNAQFSRKVTFDSSRAPSRGERSEVRMLAPINLDALKTKLATVEAETKANDPKALKVEIATLRRQMTEAAAKAASPGHLPDPQAIETADRRGYERGFNEGADIAHREGYLAALEDAGERLKAAVDAIAALAEGKTPVIAAPRQMPRAPAPPRPAAVQVSPRSNSGNRSLTGPQAQMLRALAWWSQMGNDAPTRAQVAAIAGWRITSGHLRNVAGSLSSAELIHYPSQGRLALTTAGAAAAPDPDTGATVIDGIRATLNGPQQQMFDVLLKARKPLPRDELAERCGWAPTSGHLRNVAGSLSTLEIVEYPSPGMVGLREWVTT